MKNIKLDKKGYQKILKKLTEMEQELHNLRFRKQNEKPRTTRWYDEPENFQKHLQEQMLLKQINMISRQLADAKIVEKKENSNLVDLDDIIKIDIVSKADQKEEMLVRLVGGFANLTVEPKEVSINSPLGEAIYHKSLGDFAKYKVGGMDFSVFVKEKMNMV